ARARDVHRRRRCRRRCAHGHDRPRPLQHDDRGRRGPHHSGEAAVAPLRHSTTTDSLRRAFRRRTGAETRDYSRLEVALRRLVTLLASARREASSTGADGRSIVRSTGNITVAVVPEPTWLLSSNAAPCSSTNERTNGRPSPVPS